MRFPFSSDRNDSDESEKRRVAYWKDNCGLAGRILDTETCLDQTHIHSEYAGELSHWVVTEKRDGSMTIGMK